MASLRILSKNLHYISQQFGALLGNTSGSVKFISVVVFFTYFLSYSEELLKLLSVTPGYFVPPAFWIWTAFTYCFLEIHFWEVIVDIVAVGLCGKLIEPLWGQLEMLVFFAVVNIGVAILSACFYLFLYVCTSNTDLLFSVHIHGLTGFLAGLAVAVKQIMPDHLLVKTPLGKFTNRNVPLSLVSFSLVLYVLGLLEGTTPTMFACGLLVSWIYLRFYQRHSNGTRGDMADSFAFSTFFPNVLQPPISVASNTIHSCLVKIGLCRKTVRRFDMAAAPSGVTVTLPGHDLHDSERRKQIALKALNERLSKSTDSLKQSGRKEPPLPTGLAPQVPTPATTPSSSPSPSSPPNVQSVVVDVHT